LLIDFFELPDVFQTESFEFELLISQYRDFNGYFYLVLTLIFGDLFKAGLSEKMTISGK